MSEVENNELTVSLRHQGTGKNSPTHVIKMDGLVASIEKTMVEIHNAMF
jgi:hypothetical protein